MRILLTGSSSGVGFHLWNMLSGGEHELYIIDRDDVDLDYPENIQSHHVPEVDMLINCAGHDLGGKVMFHEHKFEHWQKVINCNLISAMRITQLAIEKNNNLIVVNVTSTNNDHYWPGDLVYSLSKVALENFATMIKYEYPTSTIKEVRLGLTKTKFNQNRHKLNHRPIDDLYNQPHLLPEDVAVKIKEFLSSDDAFIRIAP